MSERHHFENATSEHQSIVEAAHQLYEPGVPFEIPIPDDSLFKLLEDAGTRYPDVIAIDYFGETLTYAQVLSQAERARRSWWTSA